MNAVELLNFLIILDNTINKPEKKSNENKLVYIILQFNLNKLFQESNFVKFLVKIVQSYIFNLVVWCTMFNFYLSFK